MVIQMYGMKEYSIHKGWKISIFIAMSLVIAMFCTILLGVKYEGDKEPGYWLFVIIMLLLMAAAVLAIVYYAKTKFIIERNRIYYTTFFFKRTLFLNEINGYQIIKTRYNFFTKTEIFIESNTKNKKNMHVDVTFFGKTDANEIIQWLSTRYSGLGYTAE